MKTWQWIALICLTFISLVVEFSMHHDPHHHHWWNDIPAFWIYFGFIGCVILIIFAKTLGKLLVLRKEDYYDTE